MGIGRSFIDTLKGFANPSSYSKLFTTGAADMAAPVKTILNTNPVKNPIDFMSNVGSAAFKIGIPAMFTYKALKPDRPDLDTAGPFEETGSRLSDLAYALASSSSSMWRGPSMIGNIAGEIAGISALKYLGTRGGKFIDSITGNTPDDYEVKNKFRGRVEQRAKELQEQYPNEPEDLVYKAAIDQLLTEFSGYRKALTRTTT